MCACSSLTLKASSPFISLSSIGWLLEGLFVENIKMLQRNTVQECNVYPELISHL